jgi:hypothetical protein
MNLILASASYVGETFTDSGLRFMQLTVPSSGKNATPVPLYIVPNKAAGETFDVFAPGCNLLVSGRLYPNRNDYKMYVVPNQPLQVVPKEVNVNQVNLAGGVGYIAEQKMEELYSFSLMCKAPSQAILNHSWQDSMGFRIESWGEDAKRLSTLLYVGRQMALAGSLRYNTWQAQDGSHRATYQVRVRASQYSLFGKNQNKESQQAASVLPAQQGGDVKTVVAAAPCSLEEPVDPPF